MGLDRKIQVKTISLSNFLKKHEDNDLIKMDIEGLEYEVVKDLVKKELIQKYPELIIEYHHNFSKNNKSLGMF